VLRAGAYPVGSSGAGALLVSFGSAKTHALPATSDVRRGPRPIGSHDSDAHPLSTLRRREIQVGGNPSMALLVPKDQETFGSQMDSGVSYPLGRVILLGDCEDRAAADGRGLHCPKELVYARLTRPGAREDPLPVQV